MAAELQSLVAWEFNPSDADQRTDHKYTPNRPVPSRCLEELGVLRWKIDVHNTESNPALEEIKQMRGYKFWETVTVAPGKLENYEAKLAQFFTEHLHPYDESRLILEGSGYWDIRGINGDWIRFHVEKGDLIVLPPGMYHRFTLDKQNYIKALLLYTEVPTRVDVMSPEGDKLEVRKDYVSKFLNQLGCPGSTLSSASSNITEESFSSRSSDLGYDSEITAKLPALSLQDDSALAIPTVG